MKTLGTGLAVLLLATAAFAGTSTDVTIEAADGTKLAATFGTTVGWGFRHGGVLREGSRLPAWP